MKKICILALFFTQYCYAQTYTMDFGSGTGTIKCTTPWTGTTKYCSQDVLVQHPSTYSLNFISSNKYLDAVTSLKCEFDLVNPGDATIGAGTELQFLSDDYADLRLQLSDLPPMTTFQISFKFKINKPSAQRWSYPSIMFYFGDKKSKFFDKLKTPSFQNYNYPYDTAVFGSAYLHAHGQLPNYVDAIEASYGPSSISMNLYTPQVPSTITQGSVHMIHLYVNTGTDSIWYVSPLGQMKSLRGKNYHIYIDSIQKLISFQNLYYRGGPISAFSWYVKDPNHFSPIIIDDVVWGPIAPMSLLPVELSRFEVSVCPNDGTSACLSWRTESEINNHYFSVERSEDGEQFFPVGIVYGHGSSTQAHDYEFRNGTGLHGTYYYRLRQVDYDGTEAVSAIQSISFRTALNCNPWAMMRGDPKSYTLYDLLGREVTPEIRLRGMYIFVVIEGNEIVCREKIWIE